MYKFIYSKVTDSTLDFQNFFGGKTVAPKISHVNNTKEIMSNQLKTFIPKTTNNPLAKETVKQTNWQGLPQGLPYHEVSAAIKSQEIKSKKNLSL